MSQETDQSFTHFIGIWEVVTQGSQASSELTGQFKKEGVWLSFMKFPNPETSKKLKITNNCVKVICEIAFKKIGARELILQSGALTTFAKDQVRFPASMWQLTVFCNSGSRWADAGLATMGTHDAHVYT